jgi:hypothetical protein
MITLLSVRIWCFAGGTEDWNTVSSTKARGKASYAKFDIGQVHGKSRKFSDNSPMWLRRTRRQEMATAVDLIHLAFRLHCRNIYICVVATPYMHAMHMVSDIHSARVWTSKKMPIM